MNILAIDYGKKYIGLALADDTLKIAMPYKVLENKDSLVEDLIGIIKEEKIERVIVGRPIGLSGSETKQTKLTDTFINHLKKQVKIPVVGFDERLTSKMADKLLQNSKENHSVAATIILQDYLARN